MTNSYKTTFMKTSAAIKYENTIYGKDSYGDLLWQIEKIILVNIINKMSDKKISDYLDFACGTGRIISFVENMVDKSTGIDISDAMLAIAKTQVKKSNLICKDILTPQAQIEGTYDLITSFRFFLNTEPEMRFDVLRKLAERLKDSEARLIFNIHADPLSYKGIIFCFQWIMSLLGRERRNNFMTKKMTLSLINQSGLVVEQIIGISYFSGYSLKIIPFRFVAWIEEKMAGVRIIQEFGANKIYVCRLFDAKRSMGK